MDALEAGACSICPTARGHWGVNASAAIDRSACGVVHEDEHERYDDAWSHAVSTYCLSFSQRRERLAREGAAWSACLRLPGASLNRLIVTLEDPRPSALFITSCKG